MDEKINKKPLQINQEIEKLVNDLNYYSYRYHVLDSPVISDEEYDRLYFHLKALEEKSNYVLPDSPTQRVGAPPLEKFEKVKHTAPMLSLDNAFTFEEVQDFDTRLKKLLNTDKEIEYTVEPKFDGLAVELTYVKGILHKASTRGDGYEGEDVTQNIRTIKAIPLKIEVQGKVPEGIDIRGEVYMDLDEFEELNRQRERSGEALFANPRNAAAGSVRQLDPSITYSRKLHLACYGIGSVKGMDFHSHEGFINWLKEARFPTPPMRREKGIDKVLDVIKELQMNRGSFSYETDGAVIKVNDFGLQQKLGVKTREPRWAIAYKFPAHQATTKIKDIGASVGRTGVITPYAIFEPVPIGGVTVSRSTLHNWNELARKDIKIGDTVVVERAGDVIPHVVTVIKELRTGRERPFPIPEKCPACGSEVVREEGEVAVRCVSLHCPTQLQEKIIHFASRGGLDIEGLGEKNVQLLYSQGLIKHFEDIFKLKKEDLLKLPRFAEKSAQNLVDAINRSKNTTLARFIFAIGILHVGEYASKLLAKNFGKLDDLYHIEHEKIGKIKQIGEKIASSVSTFFNDEKNIKTLDALITHGLRISNPDFTAGKKEENPLEGLTFVITGTLPKPRKEVEDLVELLGGHATSSVSASTDYIIVGDDPGSKLQKAKTLKVKTLSYNELMKLIENRRRTPRLF